ncbi:acetyltransferase [Acrocarpospora pleiomorpha]|uniref:Acetyltransferase n=1 Tax=Acrocarpospora pleiomorpha TaxID=90975 RepID=A0A5M3XLS1_9ACTN|nr:GNAT family N-acetyltransferase [Acrocarpospora pleiomorpha]GES21686.1 acetyltransferase [Acrocarpospora pleiomorpha]
MEIRDLTEADLDAVLDGRTRAFGPLSGSSAVVWRRLVQPFLAAGRYLGVFDGTRLVGTARINPYTQWWHGRPVSMGGVAGVTVAPEDRGRGAGRRIMLAALERAAELGHAVSALYPATTHPYRRLGWEHAGSQLLATIPAEGLRTIAPAEPVKLRRMGPDDAPEMMSVLARVYAATRASGPIGHDEATSRLWLDDEDDFRYLADDGFVVYSWSGEDIQVENLVAGSEATARALWSLVGSHATVAKRVKAAVTPDDPVFWLLADRKEDTLTQPRWMFRLVDVASALAARGYPAAVTMDAVLQVQDPQRPGNSGGWRLEVASGSGTATRSDSPEGPSLAIGGLSALYAGIPTSTLRRTGLLTGPTEKDEALDAAFAAKPYMIDYF